MTFLGIQDPLGEKINLVDMNSLLNFDSRWFLRSEISSYLEESLELGPDGVVLVATLTPEGENENAFSDPFVKPMFGTFNLEAEEIDISENDLAENTDVELKKKMMSNLFVDFRNDIDNDALKATPEKPLFEFKQTIPEVLTKVLFGKRMLFRCHLLLWMPSSRIQISILLKTSFLQKYPLVSLFDKDNSS